MVWDFVVLLSSEDILTPRDISAGRMNQGHLVVERKALAIAQKLKEALNNKSGFERWIKYSKESHRDSKGNCHYSFDWVNVEALAQFCEKSGGFRIC